MTDEHAWQWPEDFDALRRGEGCAMCAAEGTAETPHGVRVFEGQWCDGTLSRYPMRPGYTVAMWKGRHVAEPTLGEQLELPRRRRGFRHRWSRARSAAA